MSLWGTYLEELLDLSFNGVSLQSIAGGQITDHNFDELPEIRASRNPVSSSHRSITAGRRFVSKHSSVDIAVQGELHVLQAILGRIRQLIQYKNRDLVLTRGVPVLALASYGFDQTTDITFRQANVVAADLRPTSAKQMVIRVEFIIDDPVGIGSDVQTLLDSAGVTSNSTTLDLSGIEMQGTFMEQYPVYKFTVNSVTNGSNPTIRIKNGLNEIIIAQAFTASDELIVDTDQMKVKLNGELIDFSGAFPFIADSQSVIYITDTLSARNIDIEVVANPRYI
jgi:hypothetical protein